MTLNPHLVLQEYALFVSPSSLLSCSKVSMTEHEPQMRPNGAFLFQAGIH